MEPQGSAVALSSADGTGAALPAAAAPPNLNSREANSGLQQLWGLGYLWVPLSLTLCNAPGTCAHCCVGALLVPAGPIARVDSAGKPACEACGTRLTRCKGKLYQRAPGHVCHCCYTKASRLSLTVAAPPQQRVKRPYDTLGPTQQWKRRKQLNSAIEEASQHISCPLTALQLQQHTTAEEVLHLTTAERERIRTVPSLHIPCEQTIIACKKLLAATHATKTGTFANGAYITDPVRYVSVLCAQSPLLVVGGDTGDGLTKLGVTYVDEHGMQRFAALLVYRGKDDYDDLGTLTEPTLTPFTGASAAFPHIFSVLQHLIDTRSAFLNGDWPFINAILGLMAPSATHPCPICIISHNSFTKTSRYRTPHDRHSLHADHSPLLSISPERIVPTPLHLFLGISNRIILDAFSELLGKDLVEQSLKAVTTIHSAGSGGRSDLFQLNGPEIRKWIKQKRSATLLAAAVDAGGVGAAARATHSILSRWLDNLHDHLLHKKEWTPKQLGNWRAAVDDIQQHWCAETSQDAFPKLHMLRHSLEFAERHRFLGRASEAQIESYHYQFKRLFHQQHLNMAHDEAERQRRCLADSSLRAVQPCLPS